GCNRGCKTRRNAGFRAKGRGFESISLHRRVSCETCCETCLARLRPRHPRRGLGFQRSPVRGTTPEAFDSERLELDRLAPCHTASRPSSGKYGVPATIVRKWLPASCPTLLAKRTLP